VPGVQDEGEDYLPFRPAPFCHPGLDPGSSHSLALALLCFGAEKCLWSAPSWIQHLVRNDGEWQGPSHGSAIAPLCPGAERCLWSCRTLDSCFRRKDGKGPGTGRSG